MASSVTVLIRESQAMLPDLSDFKPELETLSKQYSRRIGPFDVEAIDGEFWYLFKGIKDQRMLQPAMVKHLVDTYGAKVENYACGIVIPASVIDSPVPAYMPNRTKPDPNDDTQTVVKTWAEWPGSNFNSDYTDANGDWVIDGASGKNGKALNGDEISALIGDGYTVVDWGKFIADRPIIDDNTPQI